MSVGIAGLGWVTPLGVDLALVADAILQAETPEVTAVENPETRQLHHYYAVPPKLVEQLGRNPRLRRSSAISYFAVAAGLAALENAGVAAGSVPTDRTAVVFAIADGGVHYTRRFYEQIARQGAQAASPLLFPETVYNAPASHLSALLGIDGASYTLVGDNSVGLAALSFATELLETSAELDQCVVVGSEEVDWVLCQAYRDWRLSTAGTRAEICAPIPQGAVLSEGAGAVVLRREGRCSLEAVHSGVPFFRRREAGAALQRAVSELVPDASPDLVVSSANGTFIDNAEAAVLAGLAPRARVVFPKASLGEAPGASALWQIIVAALAVEAGEAANALVPVIGFNQQASAAHIARSETA